jgi:hypothetical protein
MREFLEGKGFALSSPAIVEAIVQSMRRSHVPVGFVERAVAVATGQSIASVVIEQLAEGVNHMIRIAQMKLVAAVTAIVIGASGVIAMNQLFAKPSDPKPAPATSPATVKEASNTPKGVLKDFAAAVRSGDASKIGAMCYTETDDETELMREACAYVDASGAFSNAVADKFGADARKELSTLFELTPVGRFAMLVEMTVDQVPVEMDGKYASMQPPGVDDLTLWVVNVDGQWKLATGRLCEHWTPDNWRDRIELMRMAAQGLQHMTEGVTTGKYASFAELKRDLANIVRQNR